MYETCDTYGKGLKNWILKTGPEIFNVILEWLRYVIFIDFFFHMFDLFYEVAIETLVA